MPEITIHYTTLLKRADPDFYRDRLKEPEYEFTKRTFTGNPTSRGAYADEPTNLNYLITRDSKALITRGEQRIKKR